MLLEAFLSAVISVLLSPGFTKIREEVVKKVKNRIRSQSSFGERALKRPISDLSEKDHEEIRNIVVTTIEEYGVSKEIKIHFLRAIPLFCLLNPCTLSG